MKQTLTTLLIVFTIGLIATGLVSCRKADQNVDIKTYDQQQITAYIANNGLTGYQRDLSGGDTTGIYYKLTKPGSGPALDYPDKVFYVYTATSLDGTYQLSDSIINHTYQYVGHLAPPGLILAFKNIFKYRGAQGHVIIPSRLAYGSVGAGTGSTRLPGNESLDFYINVVDPATQAAYDDITIQKYMVNNGLTGYTKTASGLYYKVTQPGTGTATVNANSSIGIQFTGKFMNNTIFDQYNAVDTASIFRSYSLIPPGWQEGFKYVTSGAKLSLIMPTSLGFGVSPASPYGFTTFTPPPNSVLYYDFNIGTIQ